MFNKIERIHKTPNAKSVKKFKPLFQFKQKSKDGGLTREKKLEIKSVNKYYKNKLKRQTSFYNLEQWNKEFEQSLNFKKNICEFPCIDFHKSKKSPNELSFNLIKKENSNSLVHNVGNIFQNSKFKTIELLSQKEKNTKKEF